MIRVSYRNLMFMESHIRIIIIAEQIMIIIVEYEQIDEISAFCMAPVQTGAMFKRRETNTSINNVFIIIV